MRTWKAHTTVMARPEAVLAVLTDPAAGARWSPMPFDVEGLDVPPLVAGSRARFSGRLAGRLIVHATDALLAAGALDTAVSRIAREAATT